MAEQYSGSGTATQYSGEGTATRYRGEGTATITSAASSSGAAGSSGSRDLASGTVTKPIPFAAVSFVCGLVGLLVANLLLGPLAVILGAIGLRADANRRGRAALGVLLGVADIAVFLFLAAHAGAHHGSISWNFLGR